MNAFQTLSFSTKLPCLDTSFESNNNSVPGSSHGLEVGEVNLNLNDQFSLKGSSSCGSLPGSEVTSIFGDDPIKPGSILEGEKQAERTQKLSSDVLEDIRMKIREESKNYIRIDTVKEKKSLKKKSKVKKENQRNSKISKYEEKKNRELKILSVQILNFEKTQNTRTNPSKFKEKMMDIQRRMFQKRLARRDAKESIRLANIEKSGGVPFILMKNGLDNYTDATLYEDGEHRELIKALRKDLRKGRRSSGLKSLRFEELNLVVVHLFNHPDLGGKPLIVVVEDKYSNIEFDSSLKRKKEQKKKNCSSSDKLKSPLGMINLSSDVETQASTMSKKEKEEEKKKSSRGISKFTCGPVSSNLLTF